MSSMLWLGTLRLPSRSSMLISGALEKPRLSKSLDARRAGPGAAALEEVVGAHQEAVGQLDDELGLERVGAVAQQLPCRR